MLRLSKRTKCPFHVKTIYAVNIDCRPIKRLEKTTTAASAAQLYNIKMNSSIGLVQHDGRKDVNNDTSKQVLQHTHILNHIAVIKQSHKTTKRGRESEFRLDRARQ